jgi:hypothetical protein
MFQPRRLWARKPRVQTSGTRRVWLERRAAPARDPPHRGRAAAPTPSLLTRPGWRWARPEECGLPEHERQPFVAPLGRGARVATRWARPSTAPSISTSNALVRIQQTPEAASRRRRPALGRRKLLLRRAKKLFRENARCDVGCNPVT